MPPARASDDPALRAALARGLDRPAGPDALALAAHLARAFGPATAALIHYGSQAQGSGTGPDSAWDFFVIVDDYTTAYRALAATRPRGFSASRAAFLNRLLPPNVLSVTAPDGGVSRLAKCCVLSLRDLDRACSPAPADHFVRARLFQQVQLVWARDQASRERVTAAVVSARARTFAWGRPFLPARFDAAAYVRALLEVSYAAEIRPEDDRRVDALMTSQGGTMVPIYDALLASLAACGRLAREGEGYRDPRPPGVVTRAFARAWFGWSTTRATLRWAKYVALYDDWLEYVVRKVERRSGVALDLTPRERRWPLLFLWPKALRYLGRRPRRAR
ncbi:MAG: hypothetical protein AAB290_05660 [Candidatus Eisenbacteria bacterium]